MTRAIKRTAFAAGLVLAVAAAAGPGHAEEGSPADDRNAGYGVTSKTEGTYIPAHYRRHHRYWRGPWWWGGYYRPYYRPYAYPPPYYGAGRGCHRTSKIGYWHGYRARIGGTMCYDAYGYPYIVPGSRYLIHYIY